MKLAASTVLALGAPLAAQIATVLEEHKISSISGGFAGPLHDGDSFGSALAPLGDLDGDGVVDLAVGAPGDQDGGPYRGAVWILFLDPSGNVRSAQKLSSLGGFPGVLDDYGGFGSSLAPLGDMDFDGIPDLAVGAPVSQTVWFCRLRRDGTVRVATRTTGSDVLYNPPLQQQERLGSALAPIGDIDGNGVTDLAVGASFGCCPPSASSIWLVRLSRFGTVAGVQLVTSSTAGPLAGQRFAFDLAAGDIDGDFDFDLVTSGGSLLQLVLDANHNLVRVDEVRPADLELYWGVPQDSNGVWALSFAGDLDGDGGVELVQGVPSWRPDPTVQRRRGALVTAFTRPIGPPRRFALVGSRRGGFGGTLAGWCGFGSSLAPLGDLDGDGVGDLAVGAPGDPDGGDRRGAVWILDLDGSPLRAGSGVNPLTLRETDTPVMGQSWHVELDCSAHAPGLSLLAGYAEGQAGAPSLAGEVLVDPASLQLFRTIQGHAGGVSRFTYAIPADAALISLPLHVQGMCAGAPGPQLSNALDEILSIP